VRAWARQQGHKITSWHADGSNGPDNRDGLPDAVAEVRDARAGGLVIYRLDRLAMT